MQTFILPLIDSSAYEGLREGLLSAESGRKMQVPVIEPPPVLLASVNLHPRIWSEILGEMAIGIAAYSGIDTRIFDLLGPGIHLAVHDADPVIALGSGDIIGAFGGGGMFGNGGEEVIAISSLLTIFTRPCSIMIETHDPQKVLSLLESSSRNIRNLESDDWFSTSSYRIDGQQRWTMVISIMNSIKLRFGLSVEDRWLVVRNIPWDDDHKITGARESALTTARMEVHPEACSEQSRALFTAAHEKQRDSALFGAGHLFPLVWSGNATETDMIKRHTELFGYAPRHPENGEWQVKDGHVVSSSYGSVFDPRQPLFSEETSTGALLEKFSSTEIEMQFERSGLRSIIRWSSRKR